LVVRHRKFTDPRAIKLAAKSAIDLGPLVSYRFALEKGTEAFKKAEAREGLKVIIKPQKGP
jgi:threonine dehydrogenase-like Zn-dependent dehydrogenase